MICFDEGHSWPWPGNRTPLLLPLLGREAQVGQLDLGLRPVVHPVVVAAHLEVLVYAGLAQPLHAEEVGLQAGRLVGVGAANVRAAVEVDDGGYLPGPFLGERFDGPLGDAALGRSPFRGLGDTVLAAQHVVLELVEAHYVGRHVLLVVRPFDHPGVGDGKVQRGVGVGEDGDPLVGVDGARVVEVGGDEDLLLAELRSRR